ncbi:ATP-binding cassette domain-containing protein [Shumkonia mesophila]|uniref:ATP-binding cassette domain-containing protein n=1 Tax=Shumkonia mesophila TaxID=2838854 RepID=UPI0029346763|nr:ATP-binding cassette domain-containing protein [Shumkonia mesophila]
MTDPVIAIDDVVKRFASGGRTVTAIDGMTMRIGAGRITGLVGPDAAGKTTLMRLVTGLLKPDSGTIRVLGFDSPRQAQDIQAAVGYMPQRFGLYEDLTVAENLDLYADLQGLSRAERKDRFAQLMQFTGLAPFRGRQAGRLSGGMKQKLGLACTLVGRPRLLLLDEPSVGVDPVSRRELWAIVHSLVDEGMSVLWSTAYLDEAERCDDVLLVSEGKLLDAGPPAMFSDRLQSRTFAFAVGDADTRTVLDGAKRLPEIIDAAIKGSDVRLLLDRPTDAARLGDLAHALDLAKDALRPVAPGFEDAFIALLKEREAASAVPGAASLSGGIPDLIPLPAAANGAPVIRVEGLVRQFGTFKAVDGIDFQVKQGEIFGLLGPNGAGKSTTFKMLCGLLPPSDGKALVLEIDLRRAAAKARGRIGYMAQKFSLYGNMTVLQNFRFFASIYGLGGKTREQAIERELDEFALRPFADVNAADLPLGYKQRLALACAIMHQPGVLFLDEPTSGVDPLVRREFWHRINAMAMAGVTIMVTTHFMEEAEYCNRIGVIYRGRLIASGSPDRLKADHRGPERPDPTLEDVFVDLIETYDREHAL